MRIGINGFGRIGRRVARLIANRPEIELVAINDLADAATMAHLLKYDSVHGVWPFDVRSDDGFLKIQDRKVAYLSFKNPSDIPWDQFGCDYVIESTGLFLSLDLASSHIKPGVKKVIISAPPKGEGIKTIALGVNDALLVTSDMVLSNASCTTNSAAPLIKIIDELCEIESAYITTVHSYTTDQRLQDAPHPDLRRARAAAQSIVPTSTGAAKAITRIFPHLEHKIGGCGIRVPVPNGSLTDITYIVKHPKSLEEINAAFKHAASTDLKGILQYTEDPIVSVDVIGNTHSCIFDAQLTSVIGNMVKVMGWYDNETGYSARLLNLIEKLDRL
jgi:glyceraldehyde 3-phosphate dehydrogenase